MLVIRQKLLSAHPLAADGVHTLHLQSSPRDADIHHPRLKKAVVFHAGM